MPGPPFALYSRRLKIEPCVVRVHVRACGFFEDGAFNV